MIDIKGPANPALLAIDEASDRMTVTESVFPLTPQRSEKPWMPTRNYGARFRPCPDANKGFLYTDTRQVDECIVDVHIFLTSGEEICPKQDLSYPLSDGAVITIGALAC